MADFLDLDLTTDPSTLQQRALDYMAEAFTDWAAEPGSFEARFFGANSVLAAVNRDVTAIVAREIFKYQGGLFSLPAGQAARATILSTWTMADDSGYTIPQGTAVQIGVGDSATAFLTQDETLIPSGETNGSVMLVAAEAGAAANGLFGPADLIDLAWRGAGFVESIELDDNTSGGADAETVDAYLSRLVELFQLQAPRPIRAPDFATLARTVPLVHRSLVIDGYNPDDDTMDNPRMVAVWNITETGEPVSDTTMNQVRDLLAARREVTFVVNVVESPTYTDLVVEFTAVALPGWDPDDVGERANAAVQQFLSPATWGASLSSNLRAWRNVQTLRIGQLEAAIDRVEGLDYVDELTVNSTEDDVTLDGVASLPRLTSVGSTTTAP